MTIEKSVSLDGRYNINCAGATTGTIDISPVNNADQLLISGMMVSGFLKSKSPGR